jgi:hypothetical protein
LLQRGRRVLAHSRDGGRPRWRPVVGAVLPPLWHRGHTGQPMPRTPQAPVAAPPSGGPPGGFGRTNFGPHHGGSLSTSRSCRAVGLHLARWGQKGPPASINRAWRASERALFNETRLQRGRIRAGHAIKKSIGNLSRCRTDDLEAQSLGHPGRNFGPETSDLSRHCDHGHGPLQSLNSIKGLLRRICGRF